MICEKVESVFLDIYNQTNKDILAHITSKCKSFEDAKDIFQNVYLEIYKILVQKGTCYIETPESFVRTVAKQKIYWYYASSNKQKNIISFSQINKDGKEFNLEEILSVMDNEYIMVEIKELINGFLKDKSELTAKIFKMFYFDDKTIPEISEILNLNQSTVKNHIYRMSKKLKAI